MNQGRRIKRVRIDPGLFMHTFSTGNKFEIMDGIPQDAKFCGFAHDYETNCIAVFIEHQSFEISHPSVVPPDLIICGRNIE